METIKKNSKVLYNKMVCVVKAIVNFREFEIMLPDKTKMVVHIDSIDSIEGITGIDLDSVSEDQWTKAKKRKSIISTLLSLEKRNENDVKKVAKTEGVGQASIYRWLKQYEDSGNLLSSLIPKERSGGKGISRVDSQTDQIINEVIHSYFLTSQKQTISKTHVEIVRICKNKKIDEPSLGTVRNRINALTERQRLEKRHGKQAASNRFDPKLSSIPGATHPLALVQIDHTKLDIIVIDQHNKKPIGRPWLTLAIDVYSRMVVGYYLSFDAPSILNTGICIANSMLSKDSLLSKFEIEAEWPCWGKIGTIHTDNGKDFRSGAIKRACEQYNINTEFRPLGKPHFGGHIERLLGTVLKELHSIPGTTFEKIGNRRNYDSSKMAILSLDELEKWILIFITKIYHIRVHKNLGTSPLLKYKEGLLGSDEVEGIGVPERISDEKKLYIDFLPTFERTIQDYGIVLDHVYYYSDVLRKYINAVERPYLNAVKQVKKAFVFRRDPRSIRKIYFYDPNIKQYFEIPYRDMNLPDITIWELKASIKRLKIKAEDIDEAAIFRAYNDMRQIESEAIKSKRAHSRKQATESKPKTETQESFDEIILSEEEKAFSQIDFNNLKTLRIDGE